MFYKKNKYKTVFHMENLKLSSEDLIPSVSCDQTLYILDPSSESPESPINFSKSCGEYTISSALTFFKEVQNTNSRTTIPSTNEETMTIFSNIRVNSEPLINPTNLIDLVVKHKHDWKKIQKDYNVEHNVSFSIIEIKSIYEKIKPRQSLFNTRFSESEDNCIRELFHEYGARWEIIAEKMGNRSSISIRNRYYSHIVKQMKGNQKRLMIKHKIEEKTQEPTKKLTMQDQTFLLELDINDKAIQVEEKILDEKKSKPCMKVLLKDLKLDDTPMFLSFIQSLIGK